MATPPAASTAGSIQLLAEAIARFTGSGERFACAVPGLSLFRSDRTTAPHVGVYEPSLCMVAQGAKQVQLGEDDLVYDPKHYLLTSVHLPAVVRIARASPAKPFLGLRLTFDLVEVAQLMAASALPPPKAMPSPRGMATASADDGLVLAMVRLIELLGDIQHIPVLAPLIKREILYRLLIGEEGARLRHIASAGSQSQQIARAVTWLNRNYTDPLRVEDLATKAEMSVSTFHHHFRAMTALSPLQYQKQLRLREARRLMLSERIDAAAAAFEVGYESPSQFSREYRRLFGDPPLRDIARLRERLGSREAAAAAS